METKNFFAQDAQGNIMPGAACFLYLPGTTVLATGLQDVTGNPLVNPFVSATTGLIQFKAPNGEYDLRVVLGPRDTTIRIQCVQDIAPELAAPTGAGLIGWLRTALSSAIGTVAKMLSSTPVTIWEFADLVTSKPTPGDPSTWDWTPALQALLAHAEKRKVVTPGVYLSDALTVSSGTKLYMDGATIQAIGTLGAAVPLLINATVSGAVDTYPDKGIEFHGGIFAGNSGARTNSLVALLKVKGARFYGTRITGNHYQGIAFGGCRDVVMRDCELDNNGNPTVTAEGGAAIWLGATGGSETYDVLLDNVTAHDNKWSVLYGNAKNVTIRTPRWYNNKESSAFFNSTANAIEFIGGYIKGVRRHNISASGIEFGGNGLTVLGTVIEDCDNDAVSLTDSNNVFIDGVRSRNMRRDAATFPTAAHIDVVSLSGVGSQPRDITIVNHTAIDDTLPAYAAVSLIGQGSAAAPTNVIVKNGNYAGAAWTSGNAIFVQDVAPNMRSVTQNFSGNIGEPDIGEFAGYAPARFYAGEAVVASAVSTLALVANQLYCVPGAWRKSTPWSKISVNITAAAAAGKLVRLGIYRMNNGVATGLYLDAGTIAADVTGLREITIAKILPPGMYCLGVISDGTPTLTAGSPSAQIQGTIGAGAFGLSDQLMYRAFTFGPLPAVFGAVSYTTGPWPIVALRTGV